MGEQKDIEWKHLQDRIRQLEDREKELSNKLRAKEALYEKILDSLPINIFLEDRAGRTVFVNQQTCLMNNQTKEELIGKTVFDFFPDYIAKYTRKRDLEVWDRQELITKEEPAGFQGKKTYMYCGKTIIKSDDDIEEDYLLGFSLDITERKQAEERVKHMAYHDALTGLPNRWYINSFLEESISNIDMGESFGVFLLDLDHFKVINDSLGHQAGDDLLKQVAERLQRVCDPDRILVRLGGDEFVILVPNVSIVEELSAISEYILRVMEEPFLLEGQQFNITTSIGVSLYPDHGKNIHTLIKNADIAMYHSKDDGRNGYEIFKFEMKKSAEKRLGMELLLRKAVFNDELVLHYQPKVGGDTGRPVGMEALIRWKRKDLGLISPAEFIQVAEETGIIVEIGEWVLREACTQCKKWHDEGMPLISISVNISAVQFYKQKLEKTIEEILRETGLEAQFLELELTESILMKQPEEAAETLRNLKALGVKISIDDFGKGFSSLSYLKHFPIDTIKIDKSFIFDCDIDKANQAIILAVITLAHNLELNVVAEGVEEAPQLMYLQSLQCDIVQGYYFSRPLEKKKAGEYLQQYFLQK
ncbi:diguanylate cyclase (GGDEF)-like protein/PAS domain S-box-containing protein [Evansella vedderi]|uniref:Diguanylate cyclase (GGDEF)-like protein/PAS domain S-box-containing protein n=1 Tax=Evansella vedderi TaxID=38282 RepID=A0ABT9ZZC7_9BACI|nr:EAL domain-containing protein [Evansella vedderi]MDQ0256597.1 diguanylate cyclase (GGDEF)-like protein/PAS domain S-box-containing protein [Evansella vedderi]